MSGSDALAEYCRRKGIPLTVQRRAVLEALRERRNHPTAEQLYRDVRERIPSLSRMTVYRVLSVLIRAGLVSRVNQPGAAERFEAGRERHHHLVCRRCEKIVDLEDPRLDNLPLPRVRGFRALDYSVYVSGVCGRCRERRNR